MMMALYNLLTLVALPFALLYHWYRSVSRGRKAAFGERFGMVPEAVRNALAGRPLIWLHAVSVGEVIAARPLLKALRQTYAGYGLLLSVTTETGRGVAERDGLADAVVYFPFDILPAVRRMLAGTAPRLIIVMETEIWPVFTQEAVRCSIPLVLANGRISERSFPRYRRFTWFFRPILERFSLLGMQSAADRERIVAIGAPAERTVVLGNLKYDIPFGRVPRAERERLRMQFRIAPGLDVLVAGSTHPGEEEQVLAVYRQLLHAVPDAVLILVPRHPERADAVAELVRRAQFDCLRRSALATTAASCDPGTVLLVDTVGELMQLYALSDLAYVGGSLVPTGGHNLLEPASLGIPTLFGPHMANFREVAELVVRYGAGRQVADTAQLAERAAELLRQPDERYRMGERGLCLLEECSGALRRHLDAVARVATL